MLVDVFDGYVFGCSEVPLTADGEVNKEARAIHYGELLAAAELHPVYALHDGHVTRADDLHLVRARWHGLGGIYASTDRR